MGTTHLLRFPISVIAPAQSLPLLVTNPSNPPTQNPRFPNTKRCRSAGYGGRGGRPRRDSNAEKTIRTERFRFNLEDGFLSDDEDDEEFGFRSGAKQRVWWSDDSLDMDDDDGGQFGVLEDSVGFAWIFKVFSAFGWMLPAVIISLLLGTGPSAFFMALVLPFAQSALSLAADTLWGRSSNGPKPKPRTKKKPFARTATDIGMSKEKEENTENGKGRGSHQSWAAANDVSVKKGYRSMPSFGGWDDLDIKGVTGKVPKRSTALKVNEPRQQKKGKLSKKARRRDTPLLLRLLIAVFPILGSWMRLL
ncbi:hypothetical protein F0562_025653 [Nyssa sinensis]|uniref:Uncharacterized protein n=1 Tax=Nyssa sinensis TaxID=561372 RepID=A0A5J5BCM0_9ASTE|nr:hypothetical protein F0562_025653 [Nyssa sinensis]